MSSFADKISYHLLIITVLALCILGIGSHYLWTGKLNTTAVGHTMNDQVGYITAARNLADSGRLESSLYYPALLNYYKGHNLLYMPGNYYVRAFFFSFFGYSIFTAFLPNILAFIGSGVMLFLIAEHFSNRKTAYMSSTCFMLFPPVILYTYSAMMEILFVFFCLLAVFIFLKMPRKVRFLAGGLTLVVPYLIRESTLLMLPGLTMLIYFDDTDKRVQKSLLFASLSMLLFFFLNRIPFVSDIPPHFALSLLNISALYTDAFAVSNVHLPYLDMLLILLQNGVQNINSFTRALLAWSYWPAGFTFYVMVLVLSFVCTLIVFFNRQINKAFGYFTVVTVAVVIGITFSVLMYFMNSGIRQILFMVPFLFCLVFSALFASNMAKRKGAVPFLMSAILASSIFLFFVALNNFHNDFVKADAYAQKCDDFLDSLGVSGTSFFVGPHDISLDYVNLHFPIKWSFIPSNEKTLRLLADKYPIDMLIIPISYPLLYDMKSGLGRKTLLDGRFVLTKIVDFLGGNYVIYKSTDERH